MGVYLDHAASTPARSEALAAWAAAQSVVGNPSSVHGHGRAARALLEESRERLAAALGAHPTEVVFTAGGTESVNLAITGLWRAGRATGRRRVIVGAAEHHASLDAAAAIATTSRPDDEVVAAAAPGDAHPTAGSGPVVQFAPVDEVARVRLDELETLLAEPTPVAVVGLLLANNEVGTIEHAAAVRDLIARFDVPMHWDAIAAVGRIPVDFAGSGAAAMSIAGHKVGAPSGTGALLVRRGAVLEPIIHGGGQQLARSGTVDVAGAAALATAVELAVAELPEHSRGLRALESRLRDELTVAVPDAVLRGDPVDRLPGTVHVTIPGVDGEALVLLLDRAAVSASMGSACRAGVAETSHVLLAMGLDARTARGALRLTLGRGSTEADITTAVAAIADAVPIARAAFSG